jgi:hypothetical protein
MSWNVSVVFFWGRQPVRMYDLLAHETEGDRDNKEKVKRLSFVCARKLLLDYFVDGRTTDDRNWPVHFLGVMQPALGDTAARAQK